MSASPSRGIASAFLSLAFLLLPARLPAEDLAFHEPGARAASLGGAFTARADDASALFYNPAGLAFLTGIRFKAGLGFGDRALKAYWPAGDVTLRSSPNDFLGSLAAAWQPVRRITLAVGVFSPYSYQASWAPNFSLDWDCRENELRATTIRSILAVEVFKGFSLGGGVDLVSSSLGWKHFVSYGPDTYAEFRHRLHGRGLGFVAGVLWKIIPAVQVGARYQGPVTIDYSGAAYPIVYNIGLAGAPSKALAGTLPASDPYGNFPYQDVVGGLTFPRELAVGAALMPFSRLTFSVDVQWDRWRDFGDWTFRPAAEGSDPDYGTQGVPLGLGDTTHLKAGVEYRPASRLALRAGYAHLQSSVDAANRTMVYPDLVRNVYSLGFGYEGPVFAIYGGDEPVSELSFDLFVRYAAAASAASTYPGYEMTYSSRRIVFGVGVGFAF
jgi:long-chain fatty acid transport protein